VLLLPLQIDPPGLYMVQLPFLDDIRHPETDPAWVGEGHPTPDQDAVDAAADMIAALSLPDFFSGMLPNPSLQRHYQVCAAVCRRANGGTGCCQILPSRFARGFSCRCIALSALGSRLMLSKHDQCPQAVDTCPTIELA
jgi:hypothetical protein